MDEEPASGTPSDSVAGTVALSGPLTRLGVPRLWRNDPELLWRYVLGPVVAPFVHLLAPSYAYGVERVPATGGAVLAANHLAAIDHPLLGLFSRRSIYFVSKEELLEIPVVGELLLWAGTFPVRRGEADRDALRRARELVRDGRVVGVHPEGTRQRTGYPGPMKAGAVAIALAEGVPVVPCGLETFRWSVRNRRACAVVFGRPIAFDDIPRGPDRRALALARVEQEIVRLWRAAAEAVAAGFPERLADGTPRSGPLRPSERL
jgi:1-acyl-sn-glycerol-3-phosphate acyltransferase